MTRTIRILLTTVAGACIAHSAAFAQDAGRLDEVVVTATKTGDMAAQKTPLAITVLGGDRLNASGIANIKDLATLAPNLSVAQATVNAQIYIRGVGSNNVFAGSDPDVTMQVDGVPITRAFTQMSDYVDVERIEVLRGPQGTLYGRNAVGGTINVISRKPSDEFHAQVVGSYGNFNLWQTQAYVSGPIVEGRLQGSLSVNYIKHDAYYDNIVPGAADVGDANRGGVRGQLRWVPSDAWEFITRADFASSDEDFDSYSHILAPYAFAPLANTTIGDRDRVALGSPQNAKTRSSGISQEVNYTFSPQLALKSLTAYRTGYYDLSNDTDATEYFQNVGLQKTRTTALTQEFDLTANFARWNGVVGLFYAKEREKASIVSIVPPGPAVPAAASAMPQSQPVTDLTSRAIFAQGTFHLTDSINLTAGIRYTEDEKSLASYFTRVSLNPATFGVSAAGFPFIADISRKFSATTPKLGVDWQVTPHVLAYASVTKGYKSGGTNYAATNVAAMAFAPETLLSYEAGLKSEWFDRRLRVNATAFKYDYKNLQVQSLIAPGNVAIGNAATATIDGAEFELTAKPIPSLLMTLNYSLLDATYDRFPNAAAPGVLRPLLAGDPRYSAATATYDAEGKRLNAAPRSSVSASAQYDHDLGPGKMFVREEYSWTDRVEYDATNLPIMGQDAFDLINLSIGYNDPTRLWGVQLLAKNVGDTSYFITKAANGVVPAGLAGPPRTIVLQFSKNW